MIEHRGMRAAPLSAKLRNDLRYNPLASDLVLRLSDAGPTSLVSKVALTVVRLTDGVEGGGTDCSGPNAFQASAETALEFVVRHEHQRAQQGLGDWLLVGQKLGKPLLAR